MLEIKKESLIFRISFFISILVILLTIFSVFYYRHSFKKLDKAKSEVENLLSKKNAELKDQKTVYKKVNDSLISENNELYIKNKQIDSKLATLQKNLNVVKTQPIKKIDMSANGASKYYNNRYNSKDVKILDSSKVVLTTGISENIIKELEEKDKLKNIVVLQDSILSFKDNKIETLNKLHSNSVYELNTANILINKYEEQKDLSDIQVTTLKKEVKKLQNQKKLNKIIAVVALMAGGVLSYQLIKK